MSRKAMLSELMGSSVASQRDLSMSDLKDLLGERCPKIEYSPVGRMRLTTALRKRFGDDYRNLPGIDGILKEFDNEAEFKVKLMQMKQIKPKKKVGK